MNTVKIELNVADNMRMSSINHTQSQTEQHAHRNAVSNNKGYFVPGPHYNVPHKRAVDKYLTN